MTLNGQQYSTFGHAFDYFAPPIAALVAPTGGPTQGGTVIIVSGSDPNPDPVPEPDPDPNPNPNPNPNQVRCKHLDDPAVPLIAPSLLVAGSHAPSATAQPTCSQVSK